MINFNSLSRKEIEKLTETLTLDENNRSWGNQSVGEDKTLDELVRRGFCIKDTSGKCFPGDEPVYYVVEEVAKWMKVTNMEQIFDEYRSE